MFCMPWKCFAWGGDGENSPNTAPSEGSWEGMSRGALAGELRKWVRTWPVSPQDSLPLLLPPPGLCRPSLWQANGNDPSPYATAEPPTLITAAAQRFVSIGWHAARLLPAAPQPPQVADGPRAGVSSPAAPAPGALRHVGAVCLCTSVCLCLHARGAVSVHIPVSVLLGVSVSALCAHSGGVSVQERCRQPRKGLAMGSARRVEQGAARSAPLQHLGGYHVHLRAAGSPPAARGRRRAGSGCLEEMCGVRSAQLQGGEGQGRQQPAEGTSSAFVCARCRAQCPHSARFTAALCSLAGPWRPAPFSRRGCRPSR